MAVDDQRRVFPDSASVHEVILDTRRTGHLNPRINSGRDRNPSSMTNCRHEPSRFGESADQRECLGVTADFIWHPAACTDNSVKIAGFHVGNGRVAWAGITVLAAICMARELSRQGHLRARLFETELRIPQLEIFVLVAHKDQDPHPVERLARRHSWFLPWFAGQMPGSILRRGYSIPRR